MSFSSVSSSIISPVITLCLSYEGISHSFTFLLDTGAQFSLFDSSYLDIFHTLNKVSNSKLVISFEGNNVVDGYKTIFDVLLPDGSSVPIEFFSKPNVSFELFNPFWNKVIDAVRKFPNYSISKSYPKIENNSVQIHGILGLDALQNFKIFEILPFYGAKCLAISDGILPIGTPNLYLANQKLVKLSSKSPEKVPHLSHKESRRCIKYVLNPVSSFHSPLSHMFSESNVEQGLECLSSLESVGINPISSSYDVEWTQKFENSIEFIDGQYHVELPWNREVLRRVPSNYEISKIIARKVHFKNTGMEIDKAYLDVFGEQEKMGIIEKIEVADHNTHIWIPHRAVVREGEACTTKIRPVFNCSLRVKGRPSLNEACYPGVDLMSSLIGLLNYFRTNSGVLLADIAKAFLMIKLKLEEDKNRFSFIVFDGEKYIHYRYSSIIFGFICSPFILNLVLKLHVLRNPDPLISRIYPKFYVDNLIYTSDSPETLFEVYSKLKSCLLDGGFNLRDWVTNRSEVKERIYANDRGGTSNVKVLGYSYDPLTDQLSLAKMAFELPANTRRKVLSSLASVFDPLGVITPISVKGKFILRDITKAKLSWDEELPPEILKTWTNFASEVSSLSSFSFERQTVSEGAPVGIYAFCDASRDAYGFVSYLLQNGCSNFFHSKSKLSPVKNQTLKLPSLELLSAFLAIKTISNLIFDHNFSKVSVESLHILVDSQVALAWLLKGCARKKNVFVCNRLKEISQITDALKEKGIQISFHYVPSSENMADIVSRGVSLSKFQNDSETWLRGPSWLKKHVRNWPTGQLGCVPSEFLEAGVVASVTEVHLPQFFSRFKSYKLLLGVVYRLLSVVFRFKREPITQEKLKSKAFKFIFSSMQASYYQREIDFLSSPNEGRETPVLISQLGLFLDTDGLLRSRGRIDKCTALGEEAKRPLLCHKDHPVTKLIINDIHCSNKHIGAGATVNALRGSGFWVPKVRFAVNSVLKDCALCKRINTRNFHYPSTPDLPRDRVNLTTPFHTCGVDFTGHFYCLDAGGLRVKSYILIFTCFTTRAVHLEVLPNMSISEFILAFIRFTNRFGIPSVVYSDNAKTFLATPNILSEFFLSDEFQSSFRTSRISFKTIPVYAAWFGATWERLIKLVKEMLYKTFLRMTPPLVNFVTTISDIQLVMNNRPLSYVSKEEGAEVLTPNHF